MTPNDITDHIYTARGHANRLAQSVASGGRPAEEAWPEVIEELQTALEELTVAEEELHEQNDALLGARLEIEVERQRFRDLFDSAPIAYIVTNIHGVVLQANHAAGNLLNVSRPYLEGKPMVNFLPDSERRDFRSALLLLEREGGRREWKVMLRPRHAEELVHTMVAPLMARDHAMGLLFLRTSESQAAPDDTDAWFVEEAARRCGMALCAARFLARQ